jgi:hypothetical protein
MTARREVAATPNVIAADDAMPIMTSDKTLAEAQAGGRMRVGRVRDEEQNSSVKTVAARRSSERLKKLDRTATVGCSQGKICPRTSQFNGGTSHLISKRWDGRTTPPGNAGTPAGTMWALGALELWEEGATHSSPP